MLSLGPEHQRGPELWRVPEHYGHLNAGGHRQACCIDQKLLPTSRGGGVEEWGTDGSNQRCLINTIQRSTQGGWETSCEELSVQANGQEQLPPRSGEAINWERNLILATRDVRVCAYRWETGLVAGPCRGRDGNRDSAVTHGSGQDTGRRAGEAMGGEPDPLGCSEPGPLEQASGVGRSQWAASSLEKGPFHLKGQREGHIVTGMRRERTALEPPGEGRCGSAFPEQSGRTGTFLGMLGKVYRWLQPSSLQRCSRFSPPRHPALSPLSRLVKCRPSGWPPKHRSVGNHASLD
ncbi:hypothetical protein SKAU_G00400850 [Synaphobranchus kaupii]|uniref:Uncharacterized protein n=1 Tax=Synaphobranchus kaupii TaxID=118154 RepID=A0A9Q1E926_SYNKA|nr:hypothetical protein SKAU_G00400850 [Synaphobranchus kaupii]